MPHGDDLVKILANNPENDNFNISFNFEPNISVY